MQLFAQWALIVLAAMNFFMSAHSVIHGRKETKPGNFGLFVMVCVVIAVSFVLKFKAGAFSLILGQ